MAVTLGTSGVVFAATESALIEPAGRLHAFCHAVSGRWHLMGVMLSAAGSLQWYHDKFARDKSFDELVNEASDVPAGSEGLIFLPYLSGERTPHPDPFARGAWIGLTTRHSQPHLTRAVLEGVAFGLKDIFNLMKEVGLGSVDQIEFREAARRVHCGDRFSLTSSKPSSSPSTQLKAQPTVRHCSRVWAPEFGPTWTLHARRRSSSAIVFRQTRRLQTLIEPRITNIRVCIRC